MFSTNAQSRFASVVVDSVLGHLRLAQHTGLCPCVSVATHGESWALEGLFELTRRPSRALDSPRALLPELQRYKDTVRYVALSAEVPGQR